MKVVAVICARSSSTRFPNKMLANLQGHSILSHVYYRTKRAKLIDEVVIATVHNDDIITLFCGRRKIKWYCGEENDIVDRVYRAAQIANADIIVRVWGDSPLVDPEMVDSTICHHFRMKADYTYSSNHPLGENVAVISMPALKRVWFELKEPQDRLWFHKYMTEKAKFYKVANYQSSIGHTDLNYSVDTPEDLARLEGFCEQGYLPDGRPIQNMG